MEDMKKCNDTRRELINKIKELDFSIIELSLYLDTHPCDKKAINMHNEYAKQVKEVKEKYQKLYGSLTIFYPSNEWKWIEEPWPWERGNF